MMKKVLIVAALAAVVVFAFAAPALAEGYNDGGYNYTYSPDSSWTAEYGDNSGIYVRFPQAGTAQEYSAKGPHGGYTVHTNKCQDCHSTHYALGSYMLLRANSREDACTFCHAGGGGSSINIQMDNDYTATGVDTSRESTWSGYGTGHTLGYTGNAPADIDPAFDEPEGLACFNCHTPHGNTARTLEAYGSPSHPAGPGTVDELVGVSFMATQMYRLQETMGVIFDWSMFEDFTGVAYLPNSYIPIPDDLSTLPHDLDGSAIVKWTGTATEIGSVIRNTPALADSPMYAPGDPMPVGEVGQARAMFYAWGAAPWLPPSPADMMTWRSTPGNFGATPINGKYPVTAQGVGHLFTLFGVTFDGFGNMTDPGTLVPLFTAWKVYWGEDTVAGNVATAFLNMGNYQVTAGGGYGATYPPELEVWHKPLFPKGRFLLIKNPDTGDDIVGSNEFGMPSPDMQVDAFGNISAPPGKKTAIDWEWPIGPAASWGPFFSLDTNERFPLAFPWAPKGVAMENEFCTSCHDGAAGMSEQPARVWFPDTESYITAYSHDSSSRGCARAQYLNPQDGNNFGPHCANCHTGGSGCWTCHSPDGENWTHFGQGAYATATAGVYENSADLLYEGRTSYDAVPSVRKSAVANVGGQCIDGGFSYPHRTLGANMLKDQLYGVDFDGTPIAAGATRSTVATITGSGAYDFGYGADYFAGQSEFDSFYQESSIVGAVAHNLDSVCIDCHGDATFWNGDNDAYYADFVSYNPLNPSQSWAVQGWELLLKGLP